MISSSSFKPTRKLIPWKLLGAVDIFFVGSYRIKYKDIDLTDSVSQPSRSSTELYAKDFVSLRRNDNFRLYKKFKNVKPWFAALFHPLLRPVVWYI